MDRLRYLQGALSKMHLVLLLFFLSSLIGAKQVQEEHREKSFIIMLDPSGDAQYAGRQIDDCLERGISLQFVEQLKEELQKKYNGIKVVITRFAGEKLQPLQNANYSNRLDADFYVSFNFYKEQAVKPKVYLFLFSYSDDFITKRRDLYFYPYDQAHLINIDTTKMYARKVKDFFSSAVCQKMFDFQGISKIPFKPLIGIKAPAIALEVGLRQKDDWKRYIDTFVSVIGMVIPS